MKDWDYSTGSAAALNTPGERHEHRNRCGKTRMIFDQPFYGCFAMNTPFIRDDEQPTMCTNAQWIK